MAAARHQHLAVAPAGDDQVGLGFRCSIDCGSWCVEALDGGAA